MRMPVYLAVFSVLIVLLMVTINNNKIFAEPILKDSSLKAELVAQGLNSPTSMAFLDENHILVLEKNGGNVLLVTNGVLQKQPVLKLHVDHTTLTCYRSLLGIAVISDKSGQSQNVFLYYSELLDGNSQPMPSPSPSKPCGSGDRTWKFLSLMSEQSRSGGEDFIQTSGYAGSQSSPSNPSIGG